MARRGKQWIGWVVEFPSHEDICQKFPKYNDGDGMFYGITANIWDADVEGPQKITEYNPYENEYGDVGSYVVNGWLVPTPVVEFLFDEQQRDTMDT